VSEGNASLYELTRNTPRLRAGVSAERSAVRRLGELARVTAAPVSASNRRIQYWTFSGVSAERDLSSLSQSLLSYDLTFLAPRPVAWECAKTHGHAHVDSDTGKAVPELYEVLEGRAGFLVQDLEPGPTASFAALVEAQPGETVAIPPHFHHCTLNLGTSVLAVADVVARIVRQQYAPLRAARGMAYYVHVNGEAVRNPTYLRAPPLMRFEASEWSDAASSPLYVQVRARAENLMWLVEPRDLASRFPRIP
jgi:oxalate decarboxylase/phosphoglucose isomerase-like protein (cupin superfamily)